MKRSLVRVEFWDHCLGDADAKTAKAVAWGVLYKETKLSYYIATWVSDGQLDSNTEVTIVAKSMVVKLEKLREESIQWAPKKKGGP